MLPRQQDVLVFKTQLTNLNNDFNGFLCQKMLKNGALNALLVINRTLRVEIEELCNLYTQVCILNV